MRSRLGQGARRISRPSGTCRRGWVVVEQVQLAIVTKQLAHKSKLSLRRSGPEEVYVDGEDLVESEQSGRVDVLEGLLFETCGAALEVASDLRTALAFNRGPNDSSRPRKCSSSPKN